MVNKIKERHFLLLQPDREDELVMVRCKAISRMFILSWILAEFPTL